MSSFKSHDNLGYLPSRGIVGDSISNPTLSHRADTIHKQ